MIPKLTRRQTRRQFLNAAAAGCAMTRVGAAQLPGDRPARAEGVEVLNPRARSPVGLIIDDSTCLVNLNRFAMPQFDLAYAGRNNAYHKNWREWPAEIPDAFVRKFGEWASENGVKGKYSVVPYPACVGRLDRLLPGWTQQELHNSIDLVRSLLLPNWEIHPEMVTHTRVIDLKTGHPYTDTSLRYMENWDWTTGRSADEIADYLVYALQILKNVGLPCEGVTSPGGFGTSARPQMAQATLRALREVFAAEIPHYFRDLHDKGAESVAPRVEYADGLDGPDPRCVVSILGCTDDWSGGWDCGQPAGVDKFITADLQQGRMVEVIGRGEPALMVCHWTGIYWNGRELGLQIYREVVRRLHARFDNLIWMKLSEVARYWAARELTRIDRSGEVLRIFAPFACADFTLQFRPSRVSPFRLLHEQNSQPLEEVGRPTLLKSGAWCRAGDKVVACLALPKGTSRLEPDV